MSIDQSGSDERPTGAPVVAASRAAEPVQPGFEEASIAGDGDRDERLDAVAGSEFVDDRIRLGE
jgi:hypothetical protein